MNKDNAKDYLPLVQALAEGKVIQMKNSNGGWTDMTSIGTYVDPSEYRIKPEPREVWRNRTSDGLEGAFFRSREKAKEALGDFGEGCTQVCYREVLE